MQIDFDKLVWGPSVSLIASTHMDICGLESAIVDMGAEDAAEKQGTPLNELVARVFQEPEDLDNLAEFAGRQCYRSWNVGRGPRQYHENIRSQGHGSIYEHCYITFQVTGVSRTLTHELVRHRVGTGFSQESQRYVDARDIRFIVPPLLVNSLRSELGFSFKEEDLTRLSMPLQSELKLYRTNCANALEDYYNFQSGMVRIARKQEEELKDRPIVSAKKRANEAARAVLPNAAETRLVFTCNLRELRHILLLRGGEPADLEIRRFAMAMAVQATPLAPFFFNDLTVGLGADGLQTVTTNEANRI